MMPHIDTSELIASIVDKERELDGLRRQLLAVRGALWPHSGEVSVLLCQVGAWRVALRCEELDEVVMMAALTPLPEAPPWLMGMLQVGADQVPVLDLAARQTGRRREPDPDAFVALARDRAGRVGLVLDRLDGLANLSTAELKAPPADVPFAAYALGIASVADAPAVLLAVRPLVVSSSVGAK